MAIESAPKKKDTQNNCKYNNAYRTEDFDHLFFFLGILAPDFRA